MTNDQVPWIERTASVIAVYGVYALVPLVMLLMRSTASDYRKGLPETRTHYGRVHYVFVSATVLLLAAACVIWYLTRAVSEPMLAGSVSGLTDQALGRTGGSVSQTIEPRGLQESFYRIRAEEDVARGTYQVHWVVLPGPQGISKLTLRLRQSFQVIQTRRGLKDPGAESQANALDTIIKLAQKDFLVDFDSMPDLRNRRLALRYESPLGHLSDSIGTLLVVRSTGAQQLSSSVVPVKAPAPDSVSPAAPVKTPAPDSLSAAEHSSRSIVHGMLAYLSVPVVLAQSQASASSGLFLANGSYDSAAAEAVASALQSADVSRQASARQLLIDGGRRSCEFVRSRLTSPSFRLASQKGLLLQNLTDVVRAIEQQDPHACLAAYIPLALAYYAINDYSSAAMYFADVPDSAISGPNWYYRGFAFYQARNRDSAAAASFKAHLAEASNPAWKSAGHIQLGLAYRRLHLDADALAEYRHVWSAPDTPRRNRAIAANNIAYVYTDLFPEERDSLEVALRLVDQALEAVPDAGWFLDTKGWILYRLGDCARGKELVGRAARAIPQDSTIQAHRNEIARKASVGGCANARTNNTK